MRTPRAPALVLNVLIAIAVAAAIYVWLVGPIEAAWQLRAIRWRTPGRPLRIAAALVLLRLLLPAIAALWGRVREPLLGVARRPWVWPILLVALAAVYPAQRAMAYRRLVTAISAERETGRARIGLTTRPVMTLSEILEGAALPAGPPGSPVRLACGATERAGAFLPAEAPALGRIWIGPAGSGQTSGLWRDIAVCPAAAGRWSEIEITIPETATATDRLFFGVEEGRTGRPADLIWWARPRRLPAPDRSRVNLVLISLDTLRADHLGAYGYRRPVSPCIDRLAESGVLFERALSQSSWTTPSHMSLFTSLFPSVHAVDSPTAVSQRRLGEDRRTLGEILSNEGYLTAAFTGSGSISAVYGFWRGFDLYDETDKDDPERAGEDISGVFEKASRWLVTNASRPFFLFFHSYEPHAPYVHETFLDEAIPGDASSRAAALYDGDILHADAFVGQLIRLLEGLSIRDRTLVVLLSDHGEELSPRYPGKPFGHGHTLYNDLLHIPLIFSAPGRLPGGARVAAPVQMVDVMPTLLELLGVAVPSGLQGVSLVAALSGGEPPRREAFAEATNYGPERKSLQDGRYKYIRKDARADPVAREIPVAIPDEEFFDLHTDPYERHSLVSAGGADLDRLRRQLQAIVELNRTLRAEGPVEALDPETLRRLKALGYIQ